MTFFVEISRWELLYRMSVPLVHMKEMHRILKHEHGKQKQKKVQRIFNIIGKDVIYTSKQRSEGYVLHVIHYFMSLFYLEACDVL